jgi:hypothetical protein
MDILGVASEINSELAEIRHYYPYAIGSEERSNIFEAIETCLIHDLVTMIDFSICDYKSSKELIKWSYNFTDKDYIQREGESLETIIDTIDNHQNDIFIKPSFHFSPKYDQLYFIDREELFEGSFLDPKYIPPENPDKKNNNPGHKKQYIDWNVIKYDLAKLFYHINSYMNDQNYAYVIYTQIEQFMKLSYIRGVKFVILTSERYLLEEWEFYLNKDRKLSRNGKPINDIVVNVKKYHSNLLISIQPQFTKGFNNMLKSQQEQQLRGTIFEKKIITYDLKVK